MSENNGKIVVDATDLTLGEMAAMQEVIGELDENAPGAGFRYTAGLAWATKRRTDPDFTYEQALALKMSDLEIVNQDPEALAAEVGGIPQLSPESGI